MKNKRSPNIIQLLALFIILLALFSSRIFQIKSKKEISIADETEIIAQASKALENLDLPVGSLLLYSGSILGTGYNTVNKDTNIAGHAEINAINAAVKKIGLTQFNNLDRDKLILVTTFEPCEMCKGAIVHYNIKHVYFMKDKSPFHWNKKQLKMLRYEWNKRRIDGEELQDSLFNLHPEYLKKK